MSDQEATSPGGEPTDPPGVRGSLVVPEFFSEAKALRSAFDERFRDARSTEPDRFVWDYWHMPGQYTYLRTYGDRYFPEQLTAAFLDRLRQWGRDTLGCGAVSPPWFSYYVDGCVQELHADVPHGPWAYVFSITNWEGRGFSGGETVLLRPEFLDFWRDFDSSRGLEAPDLVDRIPSSFNQLTVFDARVPHGVEMVRGTHDPLDSRVVLHGWFKDPEPEASEELSGRKAELALKLVTADVSQRLESVDSVSGLLTVRLSLGAAGRVEEVDFLSNTLVSTAADRTAPGAVVDAVTEVLDGRTIDGAGEGGWAILPFRLG